MAEHAAELWEIERNLWLEGAAFFEKRMVEDALMVFPAPVGILPGQAILHGLGGAPRWMSVEMSEQEATVTGDTAVLAYQATGKREGDKPYRAYCSSTYVREDGGWKVLAHQQTPIG